MSMFRISSFALTDYKNDFYDNKIFNPVTTKILERYRVHPLSDDETGAELTVLLPARINRYFQD